MRCGMASTTRRRITWRSRPSPLAAPQPHAGYRPRCVAGRTQRPIPRHQDAGNLLGRPAVSVAISEGSAAAIAAYRASLRRRRTMLAMLAVVAVAAFLADIVVGPSLLPASEALRALFDPDAA